MSKTLNEIRKEIDTIDNRVHDLLMERAALVSSVAEAKRREGMQIVQPAREARMIRRLLGRHRGPLPQATVVRIWRELVGSVSLLQTGLTVIVAAGEHAGQHWDMAKNYFGSVVPMKEINGALNALAAVRADEASFAVLPWPELDDAAPWWVQLFAHADERPVITGSLPYGAEKAAHTGQGKALIVSKIAFMDSDDDISFIGLELEAGVSRARLREVFGAAGFEIMNLYNADSPYHDGAILYLAGVKGYVAADAAEIDDLKERFSGGCLYCGVMGGYPAVPEFDDAKAENAPQKRTV